MGAPSGPRGSALIPVALATALTCGALGNLSDDGRVVPLAVADGGAGDRGGHDNLGRVSRCQQGGVGGLGPPRRRQRAHRQPPDQTEEQRNREVRAQLVPEGCPEAVPRGPKALLTGRSRRCRSFPN